MKQLILYLIVMVSGATQLSPAAAWASDADMNLRSVDSPVRLAATNIAARVGFPGSREVLVICTPEKREIALCVKESMSKRKLHSRLVCLDGSADSCNAQLARLLADYRPGDGLVLLLDPIAAPMLFEQLGRPDEGMKLDTLHLFCDWLIPAESLVRTWAIDLNELADFRGKLLGALAGAKKIRIISAGGTDITVSPRSWITREEGEVFTAPLETLSAGRIVVDGCAYDGPPARSFNLLVESGRAVNPSTLDSMDRQQRWVAKDLSRDPGAAVVAELGIGINPGARSEANVMEAEQARGTVHFGFGRNLSYGGMNDSRGHIDYVILRPTIVVDGRTVCVDGKYCF